MKFNFKKTAFATGVLAIAISTMSFAMPRNTNVVGTTHKVAELKVTESPNLEEEEGWRQQVLKTAGEFALHVIAAVVSHYLTGGAEEPMENRQDFGVTMQKMAENKMSKL